MKTMKIGDSCVVRDGDDAQVYTIKDIVDGLASLTYKTLTRTVSGGVLPVSMLKRPTAKQLANS